ncbi:hypothetical protein FQA39_LY06261 [Lamprigera yunnana]|nr:hypothetical protein FQA39_LY06261 [Lamprigera yunnana]
MSSACDYICGASGGGKCSCKTSGNNEQLNSGASENTRSLRQLVCNPPCNRRRLLDLDKMAAEDVARLCEISDEDFSHQCRDDNDENYVPSENDEKSDVKDVLTGEKVIIKTGVEVNSDDNKEVNTKADTTETPPTTDVYCSSDSTIRNKTPLTSSQTVLYIMCDASTSHNAQVPQGHVLSEDAPKIMWKNYKYFKSINSGKNQLDKNVSFVIFLCNPIGNVLDTVVQATGLSKSTVIRILKQGRASECGEKITFANATPTPKLSPKSSLDNCGEQVTSKHIEYTLKRQQLRWFGQLVRMEEHRAEKRGTKNRKHSKSGGRNMERREKSDKEEKRMVQEDP